MTSEKQRQTRRRVLAATGAVAAFGLAGCVGGDDDDDGTEPNTGNEGSDDGETGQAERDEQTVTLLVEGVGGHDEEEHNDEQKDEHEDEEHNDEEKDEHDDEEHNDEEKDEHGHEYGQEGLTDVEIGHACNHMEEVEEFGAEDVEAGASAEDAPHLSEVHHPYSVTIEGESGHVLFELGEHVHDEEDEYGDEEEYDEEDEHGDEEEHDKEDEHHEEDEHADTGGEMLAFFTQSGIASVVEGELVYSETEAVENCESIDRYVIVEAHNGSAVVELTTEP